MAVLSGRVRPQTAKQVKADFKKNGPRLSDRELRQIERAAIELERADRLKELETRKKLAKAKKAEKDEKERQARKRLGIGKATQLAGYSHTQKRLKTGMETFLRCGRLAAPEKKEVEIDTIEALMDESENEPWDVDEDLDFDVKPQEQPLNSTSFRKLETTKDKALSKAEKQTAPEPWDLDDQTLMDFVQEPKLNASMPRPSSAGAILQTPRTSTPRPPDEALFVRLHGPIDKTIERLFEALPGPLVELLSEDASTNKVKWDPNPALLYKLKHPELPLHRLRLKVGCTVALLRGLDSSCQLSRGSHVRIVEIKKERLDGIYVDGHLQGRKTFLTRIPFAARYKNDAQFTYTRTQFPVKVITDSSPTKTQSLLTAAHEVERSLEDIALKSVYNTPKQADVFKKPAPRTSKSLPSSTPRDSNLAVDMDCWDDFLTSGTQIARELSADTTVSPMNSPKMSFGFSFCTQDLDFSAEDLEELRSQDNKILPKKEPSREESYGVTFSMPPPPRHALSAANHQGKTGPAPRQGRSSSLYKPEHTRLDPSLKELGISTQDVFSFLDDDESFSTQFG